MKCINEIKCPDEIRAGCAAPDCHGVILVGEFVKGIGDMFREIGFKDAHGRAEHLDSLEQDFVYMLVHHFFGGSSGIKRKDEQIHCLMGEFRLLPIYIVKFISIS
jgi:hypothetical protein